MQLIEKERLTNMQMADSQRLRNSNVFNSTSKKSSIAATPIEQVGQLMVPSQVSAPAPTSSKLQTEKTALMKQPSAIKSTSEPKVVQAKPTEKPQDEADVLGICSSFKAGIANIADEKLKGGNAAHMKDLNQQQVHLKQEMKSAGC
jgi:hypothetical protein